MLAVEERGAKQTAQIGGVREGCILVGGSG